MAATASILLDFGSSRTRKQVDSQPVPRQQVKPEDFELQGALPEASGPHWIEVRADKSIRLSGPDTRRVSLLVKSIALRSERVTP